MKRKTLIWGLSMALVAAWAHAEPVLPLHDADVLERLPVLAPWQREPQGRRAALISQSRNLTTALTAARQWLALARTQGDARYAGQALGALHHWSDNKTAPVEVLVMRATIEQYLHQFKQAEALLTEVVSKDPQQGQAWLTLATLRRLRGDYDAADTACAQVAQSGALLYARACTAETQSMRGEFSAARNSLQGLLLTREASGSPSIRAWLLSTLAQLEEMSGHDEAAEARYLDILALSDAQADAAGYARLAYADLLLRLQRAAEVPKLLAALPRSDAVLLRLAIAQHQQTKSSPFTTELAQRFTAAEMDAQANVNKNTPSPHGREQARFALDVLAKPKQAYALAVRNLELQREPEDLLLLARCARAVGLPKALEQVHQQLNKQGLKDARIDAIL